MLARLDVNAVVALLAEKTAAAAAFTAAHDACLAQGVSASRRAVVLAQLSQVITLSEENRKLIERAIEVQRRVIGIVARAVPEAQARSATAYTPKGRVERVKSYAIAISAQA